MKNENQITFEADVEESLANAVRRSVNEIDVLAIDEVEISKNDSALYDETIAHRIGLIPLEAEKAVNDKTEINLDLDVKKDGFVYAEELNGKGVKIVYPKIPITLLKKGEEIKINAIARAGKGKDHQKFSPGFIFYRNVADVKVEKDCPKEIVNFCPKNVLEEKGGKVVVSSPENCDMCEMCVEECRKQGKEGIKVTPTNKILITIESFGQLKASEILTKSINILKKNLEEVSKKLK